MQARRMTKSKPKADKPKKEPTYVVHPEWLKIARRIKATRLAWGLTQEGARGRIDQSQFSRWELAKELPDLLRLAEYAIKMRVSMDFLVFGVPVRCHPDFLVGLSKARAEIPELEILPTDTVLSMDMILS